MASSIQLLRSTNPQERPFAGNLLEGQPAANLHSSEPGLFFKTTDGSVVKFGPAAITSDGSPPNSTPQGSAGNSVGELWLDKSLNPPVIKVYDGATWVNAGSGGGGGSALFVRWIYTSSGGETSLSGSSGGVLLEYQPGMEEVYLNGVLLTRGVDYSAANGSSITNLSPLATGDIVQVISYIPSNTVLLPGQATLLRWTVTATASQTLLSGLDSSGQLLEYTAGFEEVFVNGAFLRRGDDYTATNGASITMLSALSSGDEVTVLAFSPFQIASLNTNTQVSPTADEVGVFVPAVNQSILSGTWTDVLYGGADVYDPSGLHDPSNNSDEVYINYDGYYSVSASAVFSSGSGGTGTRALRFFRSRTGGTDASVPFYQQAIASTKTTVSGTTLMYLKGGDKLSVQVFQDTGSPLNIEPQYSSLSIFKAR